MTNIGLNFRNIFLLVCLLPVPIYRLRRIFFFGVKPVQFEWHYCYSLEKYYETNRKNGNECEPHLLLER